MKKIIVTCPLDPNKGVSVTTEGFSGGRCQQATRKIEEALGKTVDETLTDEYYQQSQGQEQEQLA